VAAALMVGTSAQGGRSSNAQVITVLSTSTNFDVVKDVPPLGTRARLSRGDVVVADSRLRNAVRQFGKPAGTVIGRDHIRLVLESANSGMLRLTTTLPGGTLSCRGRVDVRSPRATIKCTNGTGAFRGATGTARAAPAPKNRYGADSLNTFRLRAP
jgi:hypothetical protein